MNKRFTTCRFSFLQVTIICLLLIGNAHGQVNTSSEKGYMSDKYSQAANAYRTAASNTKCPERKQYFLNMATYMGCLEDQLRHGSNVTCTQPLNTLVPDCPADKVASSNLSPGQVSSTNPVTTGTVKPLGDGFHDIADILSTLAVVMDDSASALDTFRAINKLNGSPLDQLGANLPISPKVVVEGFLSLADQKDKQSAQLDKEGLKFEEISHGRQSENSVVSAQTALDKYGPYVYSHALIDRYFQIDPKNTGLEKFMAELLINSDDNLKSISNTLSQLEASLGNAKSASQLRLKEIKKSEYEKRKLFLTDNKVDLNWLLKAVIKGDTLSIDTLQKQGFDLETKIYLYDRSLTILDLAVLNNDYATCRHLIEINKMSLGYESTNLYKHRFLGYLDTHDIRLSSSLGCAIVTGNIDIVKLFLRNGYDLNKRVGVKTTRKWKIQPSTLAQICNYTDLAMYFEQLVSTK